MVFPLNPTLGTQNTRVKKNGRVENCDVFSGNAIWVPLSCPTKKNDPDNENDGNTRQETLEIKDSWSGFPGSRLTFAKSVA